MGSFANVPAPDTGVTPTIQTAFVEATKEYFEAPIDVVMVENPVEPVETDIVEQDPEVVSPAIEPEPEVVTDPVADEKQSDLKAE